MRPDDKIFLTHDVFKIKKNLEKCAKCFCENTQKLLTGNKQMQRQKTLGYKFSFSKKIHSRYSEYFLRSSYELNYQNDTLTTLTPIKKLRSLSH